MSIVKDIAEKIGVSTSTVSLVLNNKPGISQETRKKVFQALSDIGYSSYSPRASAKNRNCIQFILYKKHGKVVSDTPFFSHLIAGIEAEARKHGYALSISYVNSDNDITEQLHSILNTECQGIILLATEMTEDDIHHFENLGKPLVVLDSYIEGKKLDSVVINNVQGAFEATMLLVQAGFTDIGYLHSKTTINNFVERMEGYKKALRKADIPYDADKLFLLECTMDSAYADMKELLSRGVRLPGAFFADNDIICIGAIKALREAGYRIPDDISIVGFDDIPMCEMLDPPLTTIRVPKEFLGMIAVDRLHAIISEGFTVHVKIEVATEVVVRGSISSKHTD